MLFSTKFSIIFIILDQIYVCQSCLRRAKLNGKYQVDMSDAYLHPPEITRKYGFPSETHEYVSGDGYILVMHRIPAPGRPAVLVAHGGLGSSKLWFYPNTGSVRDSFALKLAAAGFDVWLHNSRGNEYSDRHVNITSRTFEYWQFRLDEQAYWDIPQAIDYILDKTGQKKIGYVGYSIGTILFFKAMAGKAEYNDKIWLMVGYGNTAGYLGNITTPLRILAYFVHPEQPAKTRFVNIFLNGVYILFPFIRSIMHLAYQIACSDKFAGVLCDNILQYVTGGAPGHLIDDGIIWMLKNSFPSRNSILTVIQITQGLYPKRIPSLYYDYGTEKNLQIYGTPQPKQYDMTKITCPTIFYSGITDALISVNDADFLGSFLPNLIKHIIVNHKGYFGHIDLVFSQYSPELIYRPTIQYLKDFSKNINKL